MSSSSLLLFAIAVGVLLLAHAIRAIRHSYLFAKDELSEQFGLLLGLSVGYAFNALVPFRLGELLRAVVISARVRLRLPYVASTVVAERLSDVVAVAVIASAVAMRTPERSAAALTTAAVLTLTAASLILLALLIDRVPGFRRLIWRGASLFNDVIRSGLVEFAWSFSRLVVQRALLTPRYLLLTLAMWTLYLGAYTLFAIAVRIPVASVSLLLLGAPLKPLVTELFSGGMSRVSIALLAFTTIPVAVVIGYGLIRQHREIRASLAFARRFGLTATSLAPSSISQRFRDSADYGALMLAHFTASQQIISAFADDTMGDVVVHRILPGGSDAVTAVVEADGIFGIRKLAMQDAATRLSEQASWLRRYEQALPLPPVIRESWHARSFHYDMPFSTAARDFYEVIHTTESARSARIVDAIIDVVDSFHSRFSTGDADEAVIDAYLERKVSQNAREVLAFATGVLSTRYTINGDPYSLDEWEALLDMSWLRRQVRHRRTAVIHGDLTVDNIIASTEAPNGWYLIDPNPANIFNSPLIDWAKLMQSFNLGYEVLNRGSTFAINGESLRVAFVRSSAYAHLHAHVQAVLNQRVGADGMREIAFHELVNYLRLIPYKLRNAPQKGMTFVACASVLLRRYRESNA